MADLMEIMEHRRSVRTYTGEQIPEEKLEQILTAGLLSPSGKAKRPWELIVVTDPEVLKKLADCRSFGSAPLKNAGAAIVVVGNETCSDVWIEDCASVMTNMHLMADSLGLGSVWIQGRNREAKSGQTTEAYVRDLTGFPENDRLCAILAIGIAEDHPPKYNSSDLEYNKIHREKF